MTKKKEVKVKQSDVDKFDGTHKTFGDRITSLINLVAHALAFIALFALSTYGLRELLGAMNDTISYVITVSAILLIAYVLFIRTK